jgi:hypothetical protein
MVYVNKAQRQALKRVWLRDDTGFDSYRRFRKTVQPGFGMECIFVRWCGMWLGIEKDGYTHT